MTFAHVLLDKISLACIVSFTSSQYPNERVESKNKIRKWKPKNTMKILLDYFQICFPFMSGIAPLRPPLSLIPEI